MIKIIYFKRDQFVIISLFEKTLSFSFIKLFNLRKFFPYFYWASFWDCDSAKFYTGHSFFAYNFKDLKRKMTELSRYSDGTLFSKMTLIEYIKSKRK